MAAPTTDVLALLEATFDAVVIMDDRGRITAFNRSAEEMFGYRAADAVGRNVSMLMTSDRPRAHTTITCSVTSPAAKRSILGRGRDVRVRHRDGSEFSVFLSVGRIPDSDAAAVRRLPARHLAAPQGTGDTRTRTAASTACTWISRR